MQITFTIDTFSLADVGDALKLLSAIQRTLSDSVPTGTMDADDAEFLRQLKMDAVAVREDAIVPMLTPSADPDPRVVFGDPNVDVAGVKWDPALHASTKAKNMDGTWKARRKRGETNVAAEALAKQVTDGALVQGHAPVAPPPPPTDTVSVPPPPPVAAVVPPGAPPVLTFRDVMKKVHERGIPTAKSDEFLVALGMGAGTLYALVKPENADKLAAFDTMVDTCTN